MTALRPAQKIALLGFTEHRAQAPFGDPTWQIWGINDLYLDLPPIPAERLVWFQLHGFDSKVQTIAGEVESPAAPRDGAGHVNWLRDVSSRIPVFLRDARPDLPSCNVLPKADIMAYFGSNYFTNSVSWMLGLAIMQLVPGGPGTPCVPGAELGVFGVDMMVAGGQGSEYGWQRPSCEWLLGWARAAGITVVLPDQSDLLKTAFPYGDAIGNTWRKKLQAYRTEMSRRRGILTDQRDQAVYGIAELTGAINAADHWLLSWMPGDSDAPTTGRVPLPNAHKPEAPLPLEQPSDGRLGMPVPAVPAFAANFDG